MAAVLREAVRDGRLMPGTALPSTRRLAAELGVARGTVTQAYGDLVAEGVLATRQGAPTRVSESPAMRRGARSLRMPVVEPTAPRWDLGPGRPDLSSFPRHAWSAAVRGVLSSAAALDFGYGDPAGSPALRQALADYLGRARGVIAEPQRIVIVAGYSHALATLSTVLAARGASRIAVEDPSSPSHRELITGAGLVVQGVPVDDDGIVVEAIDSAGVVVTPAHQFPTGATLAPDRRSELLGWAAHSSAVVIEDDYDGEFRFDRQPVGALQGRAPEHVVYAGTTSKTLAPGLRIGWLVLPHELVAPCRDALARTGWRPPAIEQLALAAMISSGEYDRHVRARRRVYRRRQQLLRAALPDYVAPAGISAGLHLLVGLGGLTEHAVRKAAERRGLVLGYVTPYRMSPVDDAQGIIVGYSTPADHAFAPSIEMLRATLADARQVDA